MFNIPLGMNTWSNEVKCQLSDMSSATSITSITRHVHWDSTGRQRWSSSSNDENDDYRNDDGDYRVGKDGYKRGREHRLRLGKLWQWVLFRIDSSQSVLNLLRSAAPFQWSHPPPSFCFFDEIPFPRNEFRFLTVRITWASRTENNNKNPHLFWLLLQRIRRPS